LQPEQAPALPATPGAAADAVLTVSDLSLRFAGAAAPVVDGVSFSVRRGETLAIVGESGCGKSLTALALMGLLPPAAQVLGGQVRFEGQDLLALGEAQRSQLRGDRMAMIFQEPMTALNPAFTVGDQIAEAVRRHRRVPRAAAWLRAQQMLQQVGIADAPQRLAAYPHQLSGGMRQRVMIAMALANDPQLLIADEPTTALDVTIQAQILALVAQLQRHSGTAMVLITHDLGVVAEVADRAAVMYAGRIVETGPVEALFEDPQHPYTIGLMGSMPSLGRRQGRLATLPGSVERADQLPAGCRFAPRCPFAAPRCRVERPVLAGVGPGSSGAGHQAACFMAPIETHAAASREPRQDPLHEVAA
jgi:peptide/nickel transport system ATP-binding protein